jgi:hypothetical protein
MRGKARAVALAVNITRREVEKVVFIKKLLEK